MALTNTLRVGAILTAVTLLISMAGAAPSNGDSQMPSEPPGNLAELPEQGMQALDNVSNALQNLPSQASDTARNVLQTISDTAPSQLGDALQNLLGNNDGES